MNMPVPKAALGSNSRGNVTHPTAIICLLDVKVQVLLKMACNGLTQYCLGQ